jgi:hypothetical protein
VARPKTVAAAAKIRNDFDAVVSAAARQAPGMEQDFEQFPEALEDDDDLPF